MRSQSQPCFSAHFPEMGGGLFFIFDHVIEFNTRNSPSAHVALLDVKGMEMKGARRGLSSI